MKFLAWVEQEAKWLVADIEGPIGVALGVLLPEVFPPTTAAAIEAGITNADKMVSTILGLIDKFKAANPVGTPIATEVTNGLVQLYDTVPSLANVMPLAVAVNLVPALLAVVDPSSLVSSVAAPIESAPSPPSETPTP